MRYLITIFLMSAIWSSVFAIDLGYHVDASDVGISAQGQSGTNVHGNTYTSGVAGTMDSAYIYSRNNFNGNDTIHLLIYDDTGGYPHDLIAVSGDMIVTSGSSAWYVAPISGSLLGTTSYWLFARNKGSSGNVRFQADNNSVTYLTISDADPVNDPFADGATETILYQLGIYIKYDASGAAPTPTRRRRLMLQVVTLNGEEVEYTIECSDEKIYKPVNNDWTKIRDLIYFPDGVTE